MIAISLVFLMYFRSDKETVLYNERVMSILTIIVALILSLLPIFTNTEFNGISGVWYGSPNHFWIQIVSLVTPVIFCMLLNFTIYLGLYIYLRRRTKDSRR